MRSVASAKREGGSVLLYALVIISLVSLLFVGWVELLMARANLAGFAETRARSRIAEANGDAILRQAIRSEVLPNSSGNLDLLLQLPGNAGSARIQTTWSGTPAASDMIMPLFNPFSPGAGGGYVLFVTGIVQNANGGNSSRVGMVCSKSPALSGASLTLPNAVQASQTITGSGTIFAWQPASSIQAVAARYAVPDSASLPPFLPTNLAWPALELSNAGTTALVSTVSTIPGGPLGTLTLDLSNSTYSYSGGGNGSSGSFTNPVRIESDNPVEIIGSSATPLRLLAGSGSPIGIRTPGKVWIVLQDQASITINASGNPEAVITATGSTALNFTEGSSIRGGVYAEQNVTGNLAIQKLTDFSSATSALDRMVWIELYSTGQ